MSRSLYLLAFVAGATAGSVATWLIIKEKYAQIAQEEIDSVKEVFFKKETPPEPESISEIAEKAKNKADIMEYTKKLSNIGYTDYSDISSDTNNEKETEKKAMGEEKPYVISPDEFGELDDYTEISLTFYSDQFLTDENDELVEDIERTVGAESLNHFGEYEDDSVFVRNDRLKADFEILLDERKYRDVVKTMPHPREDL